MLVRLANGATTFFDYREVAPGKATRDMYIKDGSWMKRLSVIGYKSVAVPGTVAGLETGAEDVWDDETCGREAPAIRLAENGFAVSEKLEREFREEKKVGY